MSGSPAAAEAPRGAAWAGAAPQLGPREIHVWIVALDVLGAGWHGGPDPLSPAELDRAGRFRFALDRHAFVQRRTALREVLAAYLGVAPRDLVFDQNRFGKPSIRAPQTAAGLSFNASRSGSVAAIAVARTGRIGIDIECLRPLPDATDIASRCFAAGEVAALQSLAPSDRVEGFFRAWTRKEALVKALGGGLSIPLDAFEVSVHPHDPPCILRWAVRDESHAPWRLHRIEVSAGHVAALAADFEASAVHGRRWPA